MSQKTKSLSLDFIIHPGETLKEVLDDREMSQKELANRINRTQKHVSQVIRGKKDISNDFAKRIEYVFGISATFWMNLQTNYDNEMNKYNELNNISDKEFKILEFLKDITQYFMNIGKIDNNSNKSQQIIELRKLLGVSELENIPSIQSAAAYRIQDSNRVNEYVLFAWEKLCKISTENIEVEQSLNLELLENKIPEIKKMMHLDFDNVIQKLKEIFSECGIAFTVIPSFRGAPVQGFIKKTSDNKLLMSMTNRQKYADIFWFSLFHEIGHILNDDINGKFIDFTDPELEDYDSEKERRADFFAQDTLISDDMFNSFAQNKNFSESNIIKFANEMNVPPFIVIGRLQKEKYIKYGELEYLKEKYEIADGKIE